MKVKIAKVLTLTCNTYTLNITKVLELMGFMIKLEGKIKHMHTQTHTQSYLHPWNIYLQQFCSPDINKKI